MSSHVPDDLLHAFVDGDVGEQLAIHIATHLDECPSCATRAAAVEPLALVFAAVDDPLPPDDLADHVMAAFEAPEREPSTEMVVGSALLAAAAGLVVLTQDPLHLIAEVGVTLNAAFRGADALWAGLGSSNGVVLFITAVAVAACLAAVRITIPEQRRMSV